MKKQDDSYGMRETAYGISRSVIHPSPKPNYMVPLILFFPMNPQSSGTTDRQVQKVAVEDWFIKAVSHIYDSRNRSLELIPEVWWW